MERTGFILDWSTFIYDWATPLSRPLLPDDYMKTLIRVHTQGPTCGEDK